MSKRNSHHSSYRGPAKPIPTARRFDAMDYAVLSMYAVCVLVVALDVLVWRPY